MPKQVKGLTATVTLVGRGVRRELVEDAAAIKMVVALLSDPETSFSVPEIARKMDAPVAWVWAVLQSPVYTELLREQLLQVGMGCLARSLTVLDKIVCDPKEKTSDRIRAASVQAKFYETVAKIEPVQVEDDARDRFLKILNRARRLGITINKEPDEQRSQPSKNDPTRPPRGRSPRPDPEAPPRQRNRGRADPA